MSRFNGSKLIGRRGDEYYFADSVFDHGDGFKGVTGYIVRPVSPQEYAWASDRENVAERLQDCYDGDTDSTAFEDWVDSAIQFDGIENLMFDASYTCDASAAFEALGIEHECTDCSGCGRIWSRDSGKDFDEVYDGAALAAIVAFETEETKNVFTAEQIGRVLFNDWRGSREPVRAKPGAGSRLGQR